MCVLDDLLFKLQRISQFRVLNSQWDTYVTPPTPKAWGKGNANAEMDFHLLPFEIQDVIF